MHSEYMHLMWRRTFRAELLKKLNELKKSINLFNENFDKYYEILNVVKKNINNYYKLAEYMINNYEQKERNYQIIYNINEIIYNNDIINEINQTNKTRNIRNKFDDIYNVCNKINTYKFKEDNYIDELENLNELIKKGRKTWNFRYYFWRFKRKSQI